MLITYVVIAISGLLGSVIAWDEVKNSSKSSEQG